MKRLIRKTKSRKYFDHGEWTPDIAQAQKFPNPLSAIRCSIRNDLRNAEVVVVFGRDLSAEDLYLARSAGDEA
jgi:hypothetical protein